LKDLFSVAGKSVLITGGSRGIGLMIARGFVAGGARVYISSRKAEVCDATAAELATEGTCISLPEDISSEAGTQRLAKRFAEHESHLDVLVNNAGTNWAAPLADYNDAAFDKVLSVNVRGVFNMTREFTPLLAASGTAETPARVINIGSIDGLSVPMLETYAYSTSKAAVHHMTRVLARHLAAQHITVNAVAPGPFPSHMMKATLENFGDAIVAQVPLGRIGTPEDMAGIALFLASRAGAYVTGAIIPVDGGMASCS
jgi:NAD(P)-dependent dehydrogenase (short-subunit alcohol dehydrogenase family)